MNKRDVEDYADLYMKGLWFSFKLFFICMAILFLTLAIF